MSLPDLDILEVKSVSDMISVFETPADDAAKLIGEDDVAIFSPQLDLMIVTSQYDLEEPVTTSQTVILSVADAECTWPDPPEYVSDIVFECRWPSGANLVTEFQTFSDENATPSASLEYYRKRFAEGGTCMVFSEYDEACSAATAAPPTWSTTIPASRQSCPTSPPRRGWSASASTRRASWRPPSSPSRP